LPNPLEESGTHPAAAANAAEPRAATGLLRKYALLSGADVASRGLRFVTDIVLVRHFGQAVFGQLNVAQSIAVQGIGVATCGLNTAGIRDVAAHPALAQSIAATVILLRFCLGLIAWGTIVGLSWLVPQYHDSFELVALYGLSIFTGALTIGWVSQGRGQVNPVGLSMLAMHLAYLGGVVLVVAFGWPLVSVPLVLIVAEMLTAGGLWLWVVRAIGPLTRPLSLAATLNFLRESLPIGGTNILRGVTLASDVLLLGLFVDKAEVGQYAAAFKLYSLGASLVALYFAVLLPQLANRGSKSLPSLWAALHAGLGRSLLAVIPIMAAALVLAGNVLQLLFGSGLDEATDVLRILILALPFHLVAGHHRTALVATGHQRQDLGLVAIGVIVHLTAKVVLIPLFGMNGAAWGTFTGEAVLMVVAWHVARKSLRRDA